MLLTEDAHLLARIVEVGLQFTFGMCTFLAAMASAALAFQDVMFTFRQVITSLLPRQEYREGLFFIISKPFAQTAPNLHAHGQKHVNKGFDSELLRVQSKIPKPVLHCELVWRLACLHVQQRGTSVDARHVSITLFQAASPHRFKIRAKMLRRIYHSSCDCWDSCECH